VAAVSRVLLGASQDDLFLRSSLVCDRYHTSITFLPSGDFSRSKLIGVGEDISGLHLHSLRIGWAGK
jgi:hypothetical protein